MRYSCMHSRHCQWGDDDDDDGAVPISEISCEKNEYRIDCVDTYRWRSSAYGARLHPIRMHTADDLMAGKESFRLKLKIKTENRLGFSGARHEMAIKYTQIYIFHRNSHPKFKLRWLLGTICIVRVCVTCCIIWCTWRRHGFASDRDHCLLILCPLAEIKYVAHDESGKCVWTCCWTNFVHVIRFLWKLFACV